MSLQASYTKLLDLSRQMLALAQRQEWELLATTEAQRASLLAGIPATHQGLSRLEGEAIAIIIRQIQACDREILEYVTPWRKDAAALLSRLAPSP